MRLSSLLFLSSPILTLAAPSAERITELLAPFATGDSASVLAVFSPNITWTIFGTALGGTYDYSGLIDIFKTATDAIDGTYMVNIVSVISEGAKGKLSSIELKAAEGTMGKNGVLFNQRLVWIAEWEGEMIVSVHEYDDTDLANRLLEGTVGEEDVRNPEQRDLRVEL